MDPALDRFRRLVLADPALRSALLADSEPTRFAVRAVALAHVRGIDLDLDDVVAALADARLRWLARWV